MIVCDATQVTVLAAEAIVVNVESSGALDTGGSRCVVNQLLLVETARNNEDNNSNWLS